MSTVNYSVATPLLVAVLALTGCGQSDTSPGAQPVEPRPAPPSSASSLEQGEAAAAVPRPQDGVAAGSLGRPARPDAVAAGEARQRAVGFLRAFARTDLEQQAWWAGVSGFFTPAAADAYRWTDVANVLVRRVGQGSARLLPGSTVYIARVAVGTDAGTYTVTLVRAGGVWLVERAEPPR